MKDKEFIRKLKLLKYLRMGGEPARDFVDKNRAILIMQVKNTQNVAPQMRGKAEIGFYEIRAFISSLVPVKLTQYVFRPALITFLIIGVISTGWIASVSASMNSLPGDTLYSLKIATERAQLVMAAGANNKAKLQVEFAGRRLEEVSKIVESSSPEDAAKVTLAVANFNAQMGSVKASFEEVKISESPIDIALMAKIIDRKTSEYHDVLVKTEAQLPPLSQPRLTEAKQIVDETGDLARGVPNVVAESGQSASSTAATAASGTLRLLDKIHLETVTTTPKMDIKAQSVGDAATDTIVNAQSIGDEEIIIPETLQSSF